MGLITSNNVASAIVKLVAADSLPVLTSQLVMGNLVRRDYEPTLCKVGDTVFLPSPDIPGENVPVTVCHHVEAKFQIPDVTKVLMVPDLLRVYMEPCVAAIALRIEDDLLSLCGQFRTHSPLGAPGKPITEKTISDVETALFLGKVPQSEQRYFVVSATAYSMWRRMRGFEEFQTAGQAGLRALIDGTIGKIKDFYVFRSQAVQQTGTGPVTTHNLAFTKSAIGLVMRRLPQPLPGTGAIAEYAELGNFGMRVVMSYQPNTLAQNFTVDVLYGCGVLRNAAGVTVLS